MEGVEELAQTLLKRVNLPENRPLTPSNAAACVTNLSTAPWPPPRCMAGWQQREWSILGKADTVAQEESAGGGQPGRM